MSKMPGLLAVKGLVNETFKGKEPWQIVATTSATVLATVWLYNFIVDNDKSLFERAKRAILRLVRRLPLVRAKIEKEMRELDESFENMMIQLMKNMSYVTRLPKSSMACNEILERVRHSVYLSDLDWENGRVSGCIYKNANRELNELLGKVYSLSLYTNPLHADVFPGVCKLEAEVVRIACRLFNGDDDSCGTMTSGGTESILMACKTYRDLARETRGVRRPEMVLPSTAHAAFDKAAQYFGIRIRQVPVEPDSFTVCPRKMERAITANTIMLVASAPNFPYGTMDNVAEISRIGLRRGVPVHVDACLGGFLICFMRQAGYEPAPDGGDFDFRLPGVTSISADTHKYGFAPKGSSLILYRSKELRHYQYTISSDWLGGIYGSPAVNGSRPGSAIATCWTTLMYYGEAGYVEATRRIIRTTRFIEDKLREIEGIHVLGQPATSVIAFNSRDFPIYALSHQLNNRGWNLNSLQYPCAVHMCVTLAHTEPDVAKVFVYDVATEVEKLRKISPDPALGMYAVYGMAQGVTDRSIVEDVTKYYLDSLYYTPRPQEESGPSGPSGPTDRIDERGNDDDDDDDNDDDNEANVVVLSPVNGGPVAKASSNGMAR